MAALIGMKSNCGPRVFQNADGPFNSFELGDFLQQTGWRVPYVLVHFPVSHAEPKSRVYMGMGVGRFLKCLEVPPIRSGLGEATAKVLRIVERQEGRHQTTQTEARDQALVLIEVGETLEQPGEDGFSDKRGIVLIAGVILLARGTTQMADERQSGVRKGPGPPQFIEKGHDIHVPPVMLAIQKEAERGRIVMKSGLEA